MRSFPTPRSRIRASAAILAAVLPLAALAGCTRSRDASAEPATPVTSVGPENIAIVTVDTLRSGPTISGSLDAERDATLRAEITGPIVQTYVDAGTHVSDGELLARIDDAAIRSSQISAQSAVNAAQIAADDAARELQRAQRLESAGAIATRDLEGAQRGAEVAKSQLAGARAQLSLANQQLSRTQIRAPFAGVVAERQASAGDVVSPGTALVTVVDPSSMRLEAAVPAEELPNVHLGSAVTFTVKGYPNRTFTGRVTRVNPSADAATRQVKILASIPNVGNTLVAGLFAQGRLASESRVTASVPVGAVDQTGLRPTLSVLKLGKVQRVEVQLGMRDELLDRVEVVSGVAQGDTVLVGAARAISAGTPLRVATIGDTK